MTDQNQNAKLDEYTRPVIVAKSDKNDLFVDGSFAESTCNEDDRWCG